MKVIVIGGYPGTGKSAIVRKVLQELAMDFETQKYEVLTYMENEKYIILGAYPNDAKFPGTDMLPMHVQPHVQIFLLQCLHRCPEKTILFEGDRLFNDKMFAFLEDSGFDVALCVVEADRNVSMQRRGERSDQDPTWVRGRITKVNRISHMYPVKHYLVNNTKSDLDECAQVIMEELELKGTEKKMKDKIKNLWS